MSSSASAWAAQCLGGLPPFTDVAQADIFRLNAAIEGKGMRGITVVPEASARAVEELASPKSFEGYDHSDIAKPTSRDDRLYQWVNEKLEDERDRLNKWGSRPVCRRES